MAEHRKACAACGAAFVARRSDAKFCSGTCRSYTSSGRVTPIKRDEPERQVSLPGVRAALEAADVLESPLAGVALVLAEQLDRGLGRAAEARELRVLMVELTRGAAVSPADELSTRRAAKLAGA